jgi:hypothetical protein
MILAPFQTPNLAQPSEGSKAIAVSLDFSDGGIVVLDLTQEVLNGKLDFIQSVYIDNADNAANFDITFVGAPRSQRIRAQPYSQGWYPVSWPVGNARFTAQTSEGQTIELIFANYAMPYYQNGAVPGVLVVPNLTNLALDAVALGAGSDTQLVAGVIGQTVKLYRGIFSVDSPTVLKWTSGAGGTVLFTAQLTAGGSIAFQPSGIAWFLAASGDDLTLHSTAACNLYGGFGHVQS